MQHFEVQSAFEQLASGQLRCSLPSCHPCETKSQKRPSRVSFQLHQYQILVSYRNPELRLLLAVSVVRVRRVEASLSRTEMQEGGGRRTKWYKNEIQASKQTQNTHAHTHTHIESEVSFVSFYLHDRNSVTMKYKDWSSTST